MIGNNSLFGPIDPARLHPGPPAVGLDELHQLRATRTAAGPDVGGADLVLLDVGVGVEHDAEQVVGGVSGRDAAVGPVVRHADLVHDGAVAHAGCRPSVSRS